MSADSMIFFVTYFTEVKADLMHIKEYICRAIISISHIDDFYGILDAFSTWMGMKNF